MKNIVEPAWLNAHREHVVLLDATNNFMIPEEGREKYAKAHIAGAFHVDLKLDMCGSIGVHGGRDPLPEDWTHFVDLLERCGISNDSTVVIYDEDAVPASRLWWMLKYLGVEKVRVLSGGIEAWKAAGYPLTAELPVAPQRGKLDVQMQHHMFADIEDIRRILAQESGKSVIVDSRMEQRHTGEMETIDKEAGHIPGAKNYFFAEVLDLQGKYRDAAFLKEHFAALTAFDEIVVHCGSGVSGSVNIIAMDEIGMDARFYIGSWSDYITYPDMPIALGK